jgi:hypothetical protein
MVGAGIIIVILVLIPIAVILTGALGAAIIGHYLRDDVEAEYVDSEYLDLGR